MLLSHISALIDPRAELEALALHKTLQTNRRRDSQKDPVRRRERT
ncbi:MAG TPA: hypothetical protein VEQ85_11380 [Lacipirellulaceae bacterium]|nr:hypothetical protein [Lacipirellulaceae bacterium]